LTALVDFISSLNFDDLPKLLQQFCLTIQDILRQDDFAAISSLSKKKKLNGIDIAKADLLFRYTGYDRFKVLLDIIYQLDIFITVAARAKTLGFSFPALNTNGGQVLKLYGLFHPFIKLPIPNDIAFNDDKNICFVTGVNMAGKSTFLKSTGISVFLAHIGFPVPAAYMETSIFDGLISTINLSDNLQHGNSHFYTEVARVKHVAVKMAQSQNIVVIFDELFRGTNVKDAFDASLSVITAFSRLKKGIFIISTHIVEVAYELSAIPNIAFKYVETTFDNGIPKYSYQLRDGITEERLGMWIVKNEGIVEIIEGIINLPQNTP
jgi:DNA mismatch repair protein MutS